MKSSLVPSKREAALARAALRSKQLGCQKQAPRPSMPYGVALKAKTTQQAVWRLDKGSR